MVRENGVGRIIADPDCPKTHKIIRRGWSCGRLPRLVHERRRRNAAGYSVPIGGNSDLRKEYNAGLGKS
jgi:hypothetical protein